MTIEPGRPEDANALERARRTAEEALSGRSDPRLKAQRDKVKDAIGDLPAEHPAKLTRNFSHVLDDLVRIPGTNIRVGVDPVLSLIPWAGTAVGAAFGGVVLFDAIRLRAPLPVLARMVGNSLLDWLLGLIPFIGAFFDLAFRSNKKNLKLLNRTIADRELVRKASVGYWITAAVLMLLAIVLIVAVPVLILIGLDKLVTGG